MCATSNAAVITAMDVEIVRRAAARAILDRLHYSVPEAIIECRADGDGVRLILNSGGNAIACEWPLWNAGWTMLRDDTYIDYGCSYLLVRR